jgi:formylglycine-generating enzyme required for sulfatase activity
MEDLIETELDATGSKRAVKPVAVAPSAGASGVAGNPFDDFRRLLRLSGLNDDDMTDDQRDALCNMGENLGLTGGQAEDLIDEYLEEVSGIPMTLPSSSSRTATLAPPAPKAAAAPTVKAAEPKVASAETIDREAIFNIPPLQRAEERGKYPNFVSSAGLEMLLVTTGVFQMGSAAPGAAPAEQPVSRVLVNCFHLSRYQVTNAQYEQFDPTHRNKRAPWADEKHPVVYVNSLEAAKFCEWLSAKEKRHYRLPTEAEWEYAARGADGRSFPWGEKLNSGYLANFADVNTNFAWSVSDIDDGFAQSSPVGSYPKGASPFGIEDLAGNVWEWCLDFYENYNGRDRINPRGAQSGARRIYRGGSWKSRIASLRATARGWNAPNFSSNDVGFRIVCECE